MNLEQEKNIGFSPENIKPSFKLKLPNTALCAVTAFSIGAHDLNSRVFIAEAASTSSYHQMSDLNDYRRPLVVGSQRFDLSSTFDIINTTPDTGLLLTLQQQAAQCQAAANIEGVAFVDRGGREGVYDGPNVDQRVGIATGFTATAQSLEGRALGSTAIGPDGRGKIRGATVPCNSVGPNGRPALRFNIKSDESETLLPVIAERGYAAEVVVGRLVRRAQVIPTGTPTRPDIGIPGPSRPFWETIDWRIPVAIIFLLAAIAAYEGRRRGWWRIPP